MTTGLHDLLLLQPLKQYSYSRNSNWLPRETGQFHNTKLLGEKMTNEIQCRQVRSNAHGEKYTHNDRFEMT